MKRINQKGVGSLVLIILMLVGIGIGVFLVRNYTSFLPRANEAPPGSMTLMPGSKTVNKSCDLNLDIYVNIGSVESSGADAVLIFNPADLTAVSVKDGPLYPTHPAALIDNTNGRVKLSGLSGISSFTSGEGILATVQFKVNQNAPNPETKVRFDFDPQNIFKTNDSNIVDGVTITDTLKQVSDANITIGSGSSCTDSSALPSPSTGSPTLTTVIESSQAVVSWSGVTSPSKLDKIEMYINNVSSGNKTLLDWVYTSNCSKTESSSDDSAKNSGSCNLPISDSGRELTFRLYQNTAQTSITPLINLLKNPSMETNSNGYPSEWTKRNGGSFDSTTAHTGSSSLKVVGPSLYTYSQQNNTLKPNTQYTASVWLKTQNFNGKSVGIRYAQLTPSSAVLGNQQLTSEVSDWQKVSFSFRTPATYVNGRMDLIWELNSGATVWFDDASLCEGNNPC